MVTSRPCFQPVKMVQIAPTAIPQGAHPHSSATTRLASCLTGVSMSSGILEWVKENKEWFFSGSGAFVVVALATWLRRKLPPLRRLFFRLAALIHRQPRIPTVPIHRNQLSARIPELLSTARNERIDILQSFLPGPESLRRPLARAYENGCHIRVLILKENSSYLAARLQHLKRGIGVLDSSHAALRAALEEARNPRGTFAIRAYDFVPYFPYYRIGSRVFVGFFLSGGSYIYPQIEFDAPSLEKSFPELMAHFDEYWSLPDNVDLVRKWRLKDALEARGIPADISTATCGEVSRDASLYPGAPVAAVTMDNKMSPPAVKQRIRTLLAFAAEEDVPLTFVGSRTSVAGQATTVGGIVVEMGGLRQAQINETASPAYAEVEPGVVLDDLNAQISAVSEKSTVPILFEHTLDLSSSHMATIGGAIMNNGGGILSHKYGSARDNVIDLEVVLPDGRHTWTSDIKPVGRFSDLYASLYQQIVDFGVERVISSYPKCTKNSSGYNLLPLAEQAKRGEPLDFTQLFVGSEGTLGVLLNAKVRIQRMHEPVGTIVFFFNSLAKAAAATAELRRISPLPSALEIVSSSIFEVMEDLDYVLPDECKPPTGAEEALLLVEFDDFQGSPEDLPAFLEGSSPVLAEIITQRRFRCITDKARRERAWYLRKNIVKILNDYGRKHGLVAPPLIEDLVVPVEKLDELIVFLHREFIRLGSKAAVFGHAGDGNLHVRPLIGTDPESVKNAWAMTDRVYNKVIEMGGTISGEHGDGKLRTQYLARQYGALTELFRSLKEVIDPNYILNPGVKVAHPKFSVEGLDGWHLSGYRPTGGGEPQHPDLHDVVRIR